MDIENSQSISANRRHRNDAGSCNACDGKEYYQVVTEVTLKTISFRLCDDCRKELKRKLKD